MSKHTILGLCLPKRPTAKPFIFRDAHADDICIIRRTDDGSTVRHIFGRTDADDARMMWLGEPEKSDLVIPFRESESCKVPYEDMRERSCGHVLVWGRNDDRLECECCPFTLSGRALRVILHREPARYTNAGNLLADELQKVRDENRDLLVENAKLRRQLERKR